MIHSHNIVYKSYHSVYVALNCIVVIWINLIQVDGVVYIVPHVMVMFDMIIKSISSAFKLMTWEIAYKAQTLFVFFSPILSEYVIILCIRICTKSCIFFKRSSYSLIPQFREGIHNYAKYDIQTNCGDNDEEGNIIE